MATRAHTKAGRQRSARSKRPKSAAAKSPSAIDAGREFQRLVNILARLRGPRGCPWDREQTLESLRGFVLEETYEVLEAIDRGDHDALLGEIGDLLFEGVFLAQIETDAGRFSVSDSVRAISQKLVRRHPHVFDATPSHVKTPGQVVEQWEQIKGREQQDAGKRRSLLGSVPTALPSLLRAHEIGTRVAAVGFDWAKTADVVGKIEEEVAELRRAVEGEGRERAEEEMGDLLFSIANLARKLGIEPESALRKANQKFTGRFEQVEHALLSSSRSLHDATLDEMETAWKAVKSGESSGNQFPMHEPTAGTKTTKDTKSTKKTPPRSTTRTGQAQAEGRRRR